MNYYELVGWKNRSEGKVTKVSAERLNHMDNQILDNANAIGNIEEIVGLADGTLCGAVKENKTDIETLTSNLTQTNESLGEKMSFPNFTSKYRTKLSSFNEEVSFDVFLVAKITNTSSNYEARIEINGEQLGNTLKGEHNWLYIPVKKGSRVVTKDLTGVSYMLDLYKYY